MITTTRQPKPLDQRVALIHDWLTGMRGGEKVLECFCRLYPNAPLWTLMHVKGSVSPTIECRPIHASLLQHMPGAARKYRSYLPLFPAFSELNKVRDADLVISTSHCVAKAMVKRFGPSRPHHICYIHTPMRYAWDMFDAYFGPDKVGALASRFIYRPILKAMQGYDRATVDRVDLFIANSTYVAERVRRIYGRKAEVVPPPVNTSRFLSARRTPEDWYLVVSALVPYKKVDDTIHACSGLGKPLRIIGTGPEMANLKRLANELRADVTFVGHATDEQLCEYYGRARALLFPGIEDFGIVPVEAIACGCPVIALAIGGVLDSMTNETAVFYRDATADGLANAITEFEYRESGFPVEALRNRASLFSEEQFMARISESIAGASPSISMSPHLSSHSTEIGDAHA